ncbi:MAG: trigger factor [Lachnospiraceae bacterium]|nr:trigger factor [Lachnospiraceae bacterium]
MSCKVEKIGANKAKFIIEIDNATFLKAEDKAFNKEKGKLSIPGFRKGKVTKEMAYKVYGRNAFLEEAVNQCINDTYYDEIKESKEKILSRPKVNVVQVDIEKPFIYEAEVAIAPDFKVANYKGLECKKPNVSVTDEEINKRIDEEREKNARLVAVDRKSKNGDTVTIDFDGYVDGKQFKGGKGENYDLLLGSKSFIDNFEDQLVDKVAGDEVDVNVTFPENYTEKTLAGKPALFKVKIHEVKEKELPEADDEFVSEVSEFETLKDYKEDIKKKIVEFKEEREKENSKSKLLEEILKNTNIDIADEAIDDEIDGILDGYRQRLAYQGMDLQKYLDMIHKTEEDFRKEQKPLAEKRIKNSLILEKIAEDEKIEATDEMVDKEYERMALSYGMDPEQFKKSYATEEDKKRMKEELRFPAVLDFIYENAKLV